MYTEHFLFVPAVVLLAIVLILLSWKLLFRLAILFVVVLAVWYGLFMIGFAPSPYEVIKSYKQAIKKDERVAAKASGDGHSC